MGRGHRQGTRGQPGGSRAIAVKEGGCREDVKVLVYRIKVQGPRVVSISPAQRTPDIWGNARSSGKGTQAERVGRWEDGREYLEGEAHLREEWVSPCSGRPTGGLGPQGPRLELPGAPGGERRERPVPLDVSRNPGPAPAPGTRLPSCEPGWGLQPAPTGTAAWKFGGQVRHGQRHASAVGPVPTGHSPLCPVQDLSLLPKQRVQGPPSDSRPGQSLPGVHLSICLSPASLTPGAGASAAVGNAEHRLPGHPSPWAPFRLLPHSSLSCQAV